MNDPLVFLLAVVIILGTPGPTNTLLATGGATLGIARALPLLIGELVGYAVAITVIRVVLGPAIAAHPTLGIVLKVAVSLYLLFIAVRFWLRSYAPVQTAYVSLRTVLITTLLNPKAILFAVSVFPTETTYLHWYALGFALILPFCGFCWILIGRSIGVAARRFTQVVPRIASVVLAGFACFIFSTAFR